MEYRRLGSLNVSLVGIGCNNFGWRTDAAGTAAVVDAALDAGINFFDTADCYGAGQSEEFLGAALRNRRSKAIIATKFGMKMGEGKEGARPEYVREALDASLKRLQADTIDLYQIHLPDPKTPITETMQALNDAVKAGKVREIGCSNFSVEQMRAAAQATRGPQYFVSLQNEYSLLHREPETDVLPECVRTGVGFLPYFPLASGFLTGKYRRGQSPAAGTRFAAQTQRAATILTPENFDVLEKLEAFAAMRSRPLVELAFAWLLAHPQVSSVIAGATTPEQIIANARAADWHLSAAEMQELDGILQALAHTWNTPTAHLRPFRPW